MAQKPKQIIEIPELDSEAGAAQMELSTEKYDDAQPCFRRSHPFCERWNAHV